jgi:hypothetical protein
VAGVLASASVAAPAATTPRRWCQARASAAWQHVLSHHIVALSRSTALVPIALARDGHSFFASIYSRRFSGVGEVDERTSVVTRIKAFPDPQFDQASAAYSGRWLVWNEYHGYDTFNDFTTWAWDTQAHKLEQLGAATRAPSGQFWDSPWRGPDVRDGLATWVQGIGPDQLGAVHAYNLRTGNDLVVRQGHPGGAFLLDGGTVVWVEASARGVPARMHAASALTGAQVPLPRALQTLRDVTGLQTDGSRIAYPDAQYRSLWWARSPRDDPYEVVSPRHLHHLDNSVQVAGRFVAFGMHPDLFLAEPSLRRYVELTNRGGFAWVNSAALLVVYGPTKKVLHPILRMSFVRLRDLPPMPACA